MLKKLLLFIILFGTVCLSAQTFYWVGGSGNWNDANHWSYMSGGVPDRMIPSLNSDVIFDDASSSVSFTVHAQNSFGFKSISSQNTQFKINVVGSKNADVTIKGDANLNEYFYFNLNGKINLSPQSNVKYQFSHNEFTNDIFINANTKVELGTLSTTKSLSISGNLTLVNSNIFANEVIFSNNNFILNNVLIQSENLTKQSNSIITADPIFPSKIVTNNTKISLPSINYLSNISGLNLKTLAACNPVLQQVPPTCSGICDGKIIIDFSGCTNAPFSFSIAPVCSFPGFTVSGVAATTYTVNNICGCSSVYVIKVTNSLGENGGKTISVANPAPSDIQFTSLPPSCFGFCNGGIILNPQFPTVTPISATWSNGVTHSGINGPDTLKTLCIGQYTVVTTNVNGCVETFTASLTQPPQLLANGTSTNITCNGSCIGAVNIAPTGGTPNYTVNWSTPFTQTLAPGASSSQSGLCAGAITATVTDSKSCKVTYSANITSPPAITLTVTKTNLICGSLCDGTATITPSGGGGGPYTYTWAPMGSGSISTNLCAGPYTVTVRDNLNCVKVVTFTLTAPVTLTAIATQTNLTCNSACTGVIKLNASGGTPGPGYTYTWSPPALSTASTATALCAGPYSYTVTDNVGCTYINTVTITQPPAITLTVTETDVTCFGACNGTATGSVSGGTPGPGYTFIWSPGAPVPLGQGTRTITSLCPETYTLKATDANGCFKTGSVTITQPIVITPNASSVSPTCGNCNGSINSAPSGGTGPYTFTLQPTIGPPIIGIPPFTGLCVSLYTLSIKDALSCTITQTINLTQPNPITFTLSATAINCFNQCNSTITSTISGGIPTYTVNWSGTVLTGTSITGQCAGVHTATVTDFNGCKATASINITSPPDMTVAISAVQPNCNAQCTGIATATVTGGTPTYTVNWSNAFTGNPNPNLCAGNYTATATDSKGCIKTQTIDIITPTALTITPTNGSVTCPGSCNGSATVTPSGGTSPYTYSWNTLPIAQTTSVAVNLCAGNYIGTVRDNKGCISSATANVSQPAVLTTSISNVQPSCNICIGAATASGIGGTGPYTYSWSPGNQTVTTPTNLCVGNQTATVTDSRGCISTQTVQIIQSINIVITSSSSTLACNGDCNGVATANATGGSGSYSYSWTPVPLQTTQTATALCAGSHTVKVTDTNGCSNTKLVTFANPPAITISVNQTNVTCNSLCNGSATATVAGGTGTIAYLWSNGATTPSISALCAGNYTVTVKDANNCSQIKTFTITQNSSLTATFTSSNPSNCGLTDGAITFTPGGGTPGYTFTWNPGPSVNPKTGLNAGTYILNLKDTNGCSLTYTATLSNPVGPTVTVASNSISCFGLCTGSASLSITSATPTYSIVWSAPISGTNTSTVANGLCAGNYIATVTDANTCVTNQTLNIAQPTQISSTGTVFSSACNAACSASIDITASGGTGTLSYSWSPAGGPVEDPTNLCANTYSVIISDINGCSNTNTYVVTQPTSLTLSFNKKDVSCNGLCNGAVRAVVGGGVSPYTYTWTPLGSFPGSNLDTIINLCPGTYTVIARDLNGCTITNIVSIAEPTVLTSTITKTNATCNGQCNGTATINPTGGTLPYTFSYNTTPSTLTQITTTLCARTYTGIVTDANGCFSSNGFVITEPLPIVITTTVSNPKCNAVCNGSVATTVTGGNPGGYVYSWTGGMPPVANPTGLCAGNYTLTVSDVGSCNSTTVVAIIQPAVLLANVTFTNPVCNGGCNGIVTSNPTGGTSPYTYLWTSPSFTTQTVSGLCVGDYTVIVTDSNSCQVTKTVTLTSPTAMSVTPVFSLAVCGVSNGSIDLSLTAGGTPGYTYNWLNANVITSGQATNTVVTGIPAGIYTVVVTNAAACSSTFQIFLSDANGPTDVTITTTSVTCNGLCNGTAALSNPIGGTAPLVMSWASPFSTNSVITGLCARPIVAQVKDANGCLFFKNDTIFEPRVIVDNATITGALCFGICTGSITLIPTGGNGGYTYSWTPAGSAPTVSNLCPGVYTSTITDVLGCTLISNYNLPSIISITSNTVAIDNSCFNDCNGTLFATNVTGGLLPYTYQWTDPLGQSTATATGLCNGSYTVLITDANGCFNQIPGIIMSPSPVTFTPTITPPSCGLCNGVADINPVGGTPGYSYLWSVPVTTNTATNLCAGVYVVQITDGNGCKSNTNVIINSSSTITGETINLANISCAGVCDGSVTVTAVGGIAPITYHWVHNNSSSQSLVGLCPGSYFCNMTDASGCIRTASVVIGSVTTLTISSQVTQSSCSASTGSITVIVSGGSGPYTYTWLPAGTGSTATVTNLAPGSYTLNVSDGGCIKTQIFAVSSFSAPILNFTKKDIACSGICDGNIVLTISAATPTYSTLWSNTATTNSISALCAGAYSVIVTDANGCKAVQNFSLISVSPIVFSTPNLKNVLCKNDCNGSITTIPTGGSLSYTYSWTPVAPSAPTTNSLCAGSYSVIVTDVNGCFASESYTVISPAALTLTAVVTDASCSTVADGAVNITVAGGTPIYSYSWTPGGISQNLSNVFSGTYSISVTDNHGCKKDSTIKINATLIVNAVAGNDSTFCFKDSLTLNGSNSIGGITYQWFKLPLLPVISNTTIVTVPSVVGTNTYVLVATNGGCIDKDSIMITVNPLPIVDAGPFVSIPELATTVIGGSPTSVTGVTYTWSPGLTLNDPSSSNPTSSSSVTINYTVTVTDAKGCLNSDTITVFVYPEIKIPNGFSPNGDGKNDVWQIDLIFQFPDSEVEVYNRWGERLFYSKGYSVPFNGQYKGKDLPVGTYYYIINLNNPSYPNAYTSPLTIFR